MSAKVTPWFPPHIKPVRKGWYERKWDFVGASCDWWDGKNWYCGYRDDEVGTFPAHAPLFWRGLSKKP